MPLSLAHSTDVKSLIRTFRKIVRPILVEDNRQNIFVKIIRIEAFDLVSRIQEILQTKCMELGHQNNYHCIVNVHCKPQFILRNGATYVFLFFIFKRSKRIDELVAENIQRNFWWKEKHKIFFQSSHNSTIWIGILDAVNM